MHFVRINVTYSAEEPKNQTEKEAVKDPKFKKRV